MRSGERAGERGLVCLSLWGFGGDFVIGICFGRGVCGVGIYMVDMTEKSIGNERMFNYGIIEQECCSVTRPS